MRRLDLEGRTSRGDLPCPGDVTSWRHDNGSIAVHPNTRRLPAGSFRRGLRAPCHTRAVARGEPSKTSADELLAFEVATRDLVGVALRSVEHLEVSLPQYRLLRMLHGVGRASSTQCAEALGVVGSSVTRLADRLHASGHLVRGVDPDNRSVVTLELTDSGRRVVRQVRSRRRRQLSRVLDRLDADKRAACAAVLQELHRTLVDAGAASSPDRLPL